MKMPPEDRGMLSRLPRDPEYWNKLSDRVVGDARPELLALRKSQREWWSDMASFSTVLAAGAMAAVLALISLLPSNEINRGLDLASQAQVPDVFGIAPIDPLVRPLLMTESPPTVESLVWNTTEHLP